MVELFVLTLSALAAYGLYALLFDTNIAMSGDRRINRIFGFLGGHMPRVTMKELRI